MTNASAFSATGSKHDTSVKLDAGIFGAEASHQLVGQAYRTYLANGRSAAASTLKRGQVAGGGKKPWRQKGTGRARVGSIRVPNWRGGGVVFGPTGNQNYEMSLPVRMKRTAIRHSLSLRAEAGVINVIDAFDSKDGRVKGTTELLAKLGLEGKLLLIVDTKTDLIERATRNIAGLQVVSAKYLNVYNVMNADQLIFTKDALNTVQEWLGEK